MKPKAAAPKPKNNNSRPEFLRDGKLGRSPAPLYPSLQSPPNRKLPRPLGRGSFYLPLFYSH